MTPPYCDTKFEEGNNASHTVFSFVKTVSVPYESEYRSGTPKLNMVNSKFYLIQSFF